MKRIFLLAMAAATMVACSQNEEIENAAQKAKIEFGTVVKAGTKATVTTNTNFSTFTVSGYKTTTDMSESVQLVTGFMDEETLTKETGWALSKTFYWPLTDKVQFFATSPKQTLMIDAPGYPKFDYTVKDISNQEDLVASFMKNQIKTTEKITLPFKHLLTQVNFSIKGDTKDFIYSVTELVIKGAMDKATFTFADNDSIGSWTNLAQSTSGLEYAYKNLTATVTPSTDDLSDVTNLDTSGALFILMPQVLTDVVSVDITYTAAPKNTPTQYTFNGKKNVKLIGNWKMSKNVRYTLTLKSDAAPISMTPQVGDWTDDTGTIEK